MATAKQRAWRAKFGRKYGGGRKAAKRSKKTYRGVKMARRRGVKKGGNLLMKGFFGRAVPFGVLGLVAAGFAYSKFISPSVPKVLPMQSALTESAVIGGLPMAAGSFLANGLGNNGQNGGAW
jgi:hypothetical protein